jgi:glycyl-tRNA synthetase beta chain
MQRARAAAARASLSDDKPSPARNAVLAATILLAPGGFILGGVLLARALKKRRPRPVIPAQAGISGDGSGQESRETPASAGVTTEADQAQPSST